MFGGLMDDPAVIQREFDRAVQHHQAGRLHESERIYRRILSQQPDHADVMQNLAILLGQAGRNDQALELCRRVVALKPNSAEARSNLGNALHMLGRSDEAIDAYRRAIVLNAAFALAHYNLGNVLKGRGRIDEAIAAYRDAIRIQPGHVDALNNLANTLAAAGRSSEALSIFHQAIAAQPNAAPTHFNLGYALERDGRLDDAAAAYRQAISLRADYPQAWSNLGNVLKTKGQVDEAIAAYRRALALDPNLAKVHTNLGVALQASGKIDDAIAAHHGAIAIDSKCADAYNNLGTCLKDLGQLGRADVAFAQAIAISPDFREAGDNFLLMLHCEEWHDARFIAEEHRRWALRHTQPLAKFIRAHANDRCPDRRLRIGYVSPDFKSHVVGRFLLPLLEHHDRREFEIFCYSSVAMPDELTERFRALADHWVDIARLGDEQAAERIRADGIDILIDLAGHTAGNRLLVFARKPAPVQVSYLGYPGSTGVSAIDYRLSDRFADPADSTDVYRLPRTNWCFRETGDSPSVQPPPVIHNGRVTFGSFNILPKVSDSMLRLWSSILREVPGAHLLLKATAFAATSARERITQALSDQGIDAARLDLRGFAPSHAEHLSVYGQVDIALDTFPYHGTTTTCDALWMGVPVVTLAGQTHASRVGVSLLSNVGLPELIASSPQEYVRIAVELASDVNRLAALRREMRARMAASPLMDAPQFAKDIEAAYRQMWQHWCTS